MPGKRLTALHSKAVAQVGAKLRDERLPASPGQFGLATAGELSAPSKGILLSPGGEPSGTSSTVSGPRAQNRAKSGCRLCPRISSPPTPRHRDGVGGIRPYRPRCRLAPGVISASTLPERSPCIREITES